MAKNSKDFLVSVADVAFYVNDTLAFTGTTALNTSISVSMEDQEVTGGKGAKTLFKYKYGRKLAPTIEMADWNLAYIAANTGSAIATGLRDVFQIAECVTLTKGVGTLTKTPVTGEKVFVEKEDGSIVEVLPSGNSITVGNADATVKATYKFSKSVKYITIDADSAPLIGRLVLTADKYNNTKGKVGQVQIEIPSFQPNGTFDLSLEAEGVSSFSIEGDALAVEGASCSDGTVYAYVTEVPDAESDVAISDIAVTPAEVTIKGKGTATLSVIGIRGGLYSNVSIDAKDCDFASETAGTATVKDGVITGVAAGTAYVTVTHKTSGAKDIVKVVVS